MNDWTVVTITPTPDDHNVKALGEKDKIEIDIDQTLSLGFPGAVKNVSYRAIKLVIDAKARRVIIRQFPVPRISFKENPKFKITDASKSCARCGGK